MFAGDSVGIGHLHRLKWQDIGEEAVFQFALLGGGYPGRIKGSAPHGLRRPDDLDGFGRQIG